MISTTSLIAGIAILAVGTYAMRISGILLNNKTGMSERVKEMFSLSAIVILFSVAMTSTFLMVTNSLILPRLLVWVLRAF